MAKNGNGVTAERMIEEIEASRGNVSVAADVLGIGRTTFYTYLKKFTTVRQKLDEVRERRHDHVEDRLMDSIDNGNIAAIIFYLKTQCKHRGYIERTQQEHMGKDGDGAIKIRIIKSTVGA